MALNWIGRALHRPGVSPAQVHQFDASVRTVKMTMRDANRYGDSGEGYDNVETFLTTCPRSLYVIWHEWESGLDKKILHVYLQQKSKVKTDESIVVRSWFGTEF